MYRSFYKWTDVTIETVCNDANAALHLDQFWQKFFLVTSLTTPQTELTVSLHFQPMSAPPADRSGLKQVWQRGESTVWQTAHGLCLQIGTTSLVIDSIRGYAEGTLDVGFWAYSLAEQRDFFMRSLLMLFRSAKIYGLHANGVVHDDRGVLLIGHSGSGKTTLTLSLVQAGWRYLGDDVVALRLGQEGVEAVALQRGFACTPQTFTFFPGLPVVTTEQLDPVRQKQRLVLTEQYDQQLVSTCLPRVLLFPMITDAQQSRLIRLDKTETLLALMEQSAALLVEPRTAALQMALLQQLGEQTEGYRLLLGSDGYSDPSTVASLLGSL